MREDGGPGGATPGVSLRLGGASSHISKHAAWPRRPPAHMIRALPGKLTFWRRRAVAGLAVVTAGVGVWVALADGTTGGTTAAELSARRLAGERLIAGFDG